MSKKIELGDRARDTITGFEGIAVAQTKWLHGCNRITLQPEKLKDGKVIGAMTFDEPQLEFVKASIVLGTADTGGPRPEPTRH